MERQRIWHAILAPALILLVVSSEGWGLAVWPTGMSSQRLLQATDGDKRKNEHSGWQPSFQQLWQLRGSSGMTSYLPSYFRSTNLRWYEKKADLSMHPVPYKCPRRSPRCQNGGMGPRRTWAPSYRAWICVCLCPKKFGGPICRFKLD